MISLLKIFGLSNKEAAICLKLLEMGAQPISVVARYVDIPRPSMYPILDRLKRSQLVEEFTKHGIKYIQCIPVEDMQRLMILKESEIKKNLAEFTKQKPNLMALENKLSSTPSIRFYQGRKEVMKMYDRVLSEGTFSAVFNPTSVKKNLPEYHYQIGETINKNQWRVREFAVDGLEAHEYKKMFQSDLHKIKILPKDMKFPSDTIIFQDKLYMISYGDLDLTGTEIINHSLAQTQQVLFDFLWDSN